MSSDAIAAYYTRRLAYQAARIIIHLRVSAPGEESVLSRRQRLGACSLPPSPHFPIIRKKITPVYQAPLPSLASPLDALNPIPQACSYPSLRPAPALTPYSKSHRLRYPFPPTPKSQHQLHHHPPQDINCLFISKNLFFTYLPSYPIT